MSKDILLAAVGGALSGLLYLAVVTGSTGGVMFAYLSQVPLFLIGLGLGLSPAIVAGSVALLIITGAGGWLSAIVLLATNIGPVWLLVRQALLHRPGAAPGVFEWYPPGLLLGWLVGMAAVGLLGVTIFLAGHAEGVEGAVRDSLTQAIGAMIPADQATGIEPGAIAAQFAPIFLGVVAVSWMLMVAINGTLAQGVLAGFGRSLRPSPPIASVELPRWCYAALVAAALIAIAAEGTLGYIARNLAIAFTVPFFFQGLGVFHAIIGRWSARTFAFVAFYIVLVVFVWPVVFVVAAGLAEPLARVRQRLAGPRE